MPWFVDKNNCVIEGTKENPGKKVKCHATKPKALAHMGALYANVEDVKEIIPDVLFIYKRGQEDRFVMIATADEKDGDEETFGFEAMDHSLRDMKETGEMPEARVFHIRGLKVGNVDKAARFGKFLVLEGKWDDTPQAKEINRLVQDKQSNLKNVSVGFSVDEATGKCPCGARLIVGPLALRAFFKCPKCEEIHLGRELSGVRFTKARIFDATLTDRPAVKSTAVASFSIQKEFNMALTRDELKERLVANGFDEVLADTWLESIPDEDLVRMKEKDALERFKEDMAEAAKKADETLKTGATEDDDDDKKKPRMIGFKGGEGKCPGCGMRLKFGGSDDEKRKEATEVEIDLEPLRELVETVVKETLVEVLKDVQIDLPDVEKRFDAIDAEVAVIKEIVNKTVTEAAAEFLKGSSDGTRSRLKFRTRTETKEKEQDDTSEQEGEIEAGDGKRYKTVSDMFGEGDNA